MKRKLIQLSERYASALRRHLTQSPGAGLLSAHKWGRQAVSLGLETLDVARVHEQALAGMNASSRRDGNIKRAKLFFSEAIIPIEKTHRPALLVNIRLNQLKKALGRRAAHLAAAHRSLKEGIARRRRVEKTLRERGGHSRKLLEESQSLQKHLRHLTHQILSAQEDKRKKISRELQDEIGQTLLGIDVRLLSLKRRAAINATGLQKEVARTRRLVDKSMKSIERFVRAFGRHYET